MKLFKVERTDDWGYDEYSDFVCCANSEDEAVRMHPGNQDENPPMYNWTPEGWFVAYFHPTEEHKGFYSNTTWPEDLSLFKVTELGEATKLNYPHIICASYHAG